MFGNRSIPSGGVARPFHTRSMRSSRALPDRWLSTQTWEVIFARTLRGRGKPLIRPHDERAEGACEDGGEHDADLGELLT